MKESALAVGNDIGSNGEVLKLRKSLRSAKAERFESFKTWMQYIQI